MEKIEIQNKKPALSLAVTIDPLYNFTYHVSNLLGNINKLLIKYFYSEPLAQRIYVILCELLNNVVDHIEDKSSKCKVLLSINPETVIIKVKNKTNEDQFLKVKNYITTIKKIDDQKTYFSQIIAERRKAGLTGGLGFLRLIIEDTKNISVKYNKKNAYMTVISIIKSRSDI
ncbi:MAG: hypothetical protein JXB88_05955 [Spirochaetales bacterium]|nr:hypothetical protein [Spirochaetales bacterium]